MLEPDLMVHIISYLCLIVGTQIEKVVEVLRTRKGTVAISERFISAFWGAWQKFASTFCLWTAHYPPRLKVPKKQNLEHTQGKDWVEKSQFRIYLLTTTNKHINESCTLLSSSSLCGHSPKRRWCDEPGEGKAKHSCFKISLTGKLISALKLSFLKLKQEKLRRGKKKTFKVSEFFTFHL